MLDESPLVSIEKLRVEFETNDGVVVGVNANPSLPLSPGGQTDRLIAEATSKDNLGMMYIWWMPWF